MERTQGGREVRVVLRADGSPVARAELFHLAPDVVAEALDAADRHRFFAALGVDHEMALREWGTSTRADERGVARVPVETGLIVSRSDAFYGQGMRPRADDKVWTIRSEHDSTVEIDVVDATGRPAVGVQVGAGVTEDVGDRLRWLGSAAGPVSDEAGRVTVRHAQFLRRREAKLLDPPMRLTPMELGLWNRYGLSSTWMHWPRNRCAWCWRHTARSRSRSSIAWTEP